MGDRAAQRRSIPHLQWDDNHEDLFVFVGKDMLDKSPASANERDGDEQQGPFQTEKEKCHRHKWVSLESHPAS